MSGIGIVTDTVGCIPAEFAREHDIRLAPVGLVIDGKQYRDTEITNDEFWRIFHAAKEPPSTTGVGVEDFYSKFIELAKDKDTIICFVLSEALSATHEAAVQARQRALEELPNLRIEIFDTETATGAEGFIIMEAARALRAGKSLDETLQIAGDMVPKVKWLMGLETLKYLVRIGRVPKVAMVGEYLNIKPIIGMVSGRKVIDNLSRAMGKQKAMEKVVSMMADYADTSKPLHVNVHYTDNIAEGEKLLDMIASRYNCVETYLTPFTAVMCIATGPVLTVAFYAD